MLRDVMILHREGVAYDETERAAIHRHFRASTSRLDIRTGVLVIGRYSTEPWYREQEADIRRLGARLVNSYEEHEWVSRLDAWVPTLAEMTPATWNSLEDFEREVDPHTTGSFVLKGATYSRKHDWATSMYAECAGDVERLYGRLMNDPMVGRDGVFIREYVPLVDHGTMPSGLPISNEYRFFVLDGVIVDGGFYWSEYVDHVGVSTDTNRVPKDFLLSAVDRIGRKSRFYTVDVAEKKAGGWTVIELGDAQMAGLVSIPPERFYHRLRRTLERGSPD